MKKHIDKIFKLIAKEQANISTVGVFVWLMYHQNTLVTLDEIMSNTGIKSEKTLTKHITNLVHSGLLIKHRTSNGLLFEIPRKVKNTVSETYSSYSSSINSYLDNQEEVFEEILADLNQQANREGKECFRLGKETKRLIRARLVEGFTVQDFCMVHRNMRHWLEDEKMAQFYRPQTLYRPNNFPKYLETRKEVKKKTVADKWNSPEMKEKIAKEEARLKAKMERHLEKQRETA